MTVGDGAATRIRTLMATVEALSRNGLMKLNFSEVSAPAGVSRPTLYRWLASKEELLAASGVYEHQMFDGGTSRAAAALRGFDKLEPRCGSSLDTNGPTPMFG